MSIKQPGELTRQGDTGPAVITLKQRLKAAGFWPRTYPINNGFGPRTAARVRAFQKARGLTIDAQVGPNTWQALSQPTYTKVKGERAGVMRWLNAAIGTVEHPPSSNQGPRITGWQELAGFPGGGVAWCQCFANASAHAITKGRINSAWFGGYTPSVVDMARNGQHGLRLIPLAAARPGDWVYFKFPGQSNDPCDHVGVFESQNGGTVTCVEGNTSAPAAAGSQSNGGGVFRRRRDKSIVAFAVHVPYKD